MDLQFSICSWPAAYYMSQTYSWVKGMFYVKPMGLYFEVPPKKKHRKRSSKKRIMFMIRFEHVSRVEKKIANLIYPAIVVYGAKQDRDRYWFASFPNRKSSYNMIVHFWKEHLAMIQRGDSVSTPGTIISNNEYSDIVLHDSMSELDIWLSRWRFVSRPITEPILLGKDGIHHAYVFPIIYNRFIPDKVMAQYEGVLRISNEGLTILSNNQHKIFHYKLEDITEIRILNPYQMIIWKISEHGYTDVSYAIVSTRLVEIIKVLYFINSLKKIVSTGILAIYIT
ncbi:unnamed protein product [Owenia fusiformis]|uniref:Uncharacterized protein n=1 Tax=Owenia fusiformis TaxID=6347 RepID=A0A8J1UU26_OWEFU|nr:unnamed protein product [Owenia fusiformis]